MHDLIRDIALCIVAAWALGVLAHLFRQPVILAYLVAGFALGPNGFHFIQEETSIEVISELGLIFLLFMIGLEIDLKKVLSAGPTILGTAGTQILGGTLAASLAFWLLGYPFAAGKWDALYLGVAASLSSTVIIVKILYDRRELDTLPGRITLGVLVLQDLFAILFLAVQPSLDRLQWLVLAGSIARVALLVAAALAISRFILPAIFRRVARLPELVLVGALAWCFLVGELGARLSLSREMGALIAGVALSTFPYAIDVTGKITTLRDFFITLFFVGLGIKVPLPGITLVQGAIAFAALTLVTRWVTTFIPLYLLKQGLRTSILPALHLSQVSEFSLVVMELGAKSKHIQDSSSGIVSLAFVALAALSSLAINRSDSLSRSIVLALKRAGLRDLDTTRLPTSAPRAAEPAPSPAAQPHDPAGPPAHTHGTPILILGFFRTASSLLEELSRSQPGLLRQLTVVDFNPHVNEELKRRGIPVVYGDISQRETLIHAGIEHAELLVCTIPNSLLKGTTSERLVRHLHTLNPKAKIIAVAELLAEVPALYAAGAQYVCTGRILEAADLATAVCASREDRLDSIREAAEQLIHDRREVLP